MRTLLPDDHRPRFQSLGEAVIYKIVHGLLRQDPRLRCPTYPSDGEALFRWCQSSGVDSARVVLSLAGEPDDESARAIEALTCLKIPAHPEPGSFWFAYRNRPADPPPTRRSPATPENRDEPGGDLRVVVSVVDNPRKPGSEAFEGYKHWRVGATVQELLDTGLPRRNLRRDVRHGHVVLGDSK